MSKVASILACCLWASVAFAYLPVSMPGDLTGDGRDDLVLFDEDRLFWRAYSVEGEVLVNGLEFGEYGALPLVGRFDGSNRSLLAYYHPLAATWVILDDHFLDDSSMTTVAVGRQGIPVVGAFQTAGTDNLALFDPMDGEWTAWDRDGNVLFTGMRFGRDGAQLGAGDTTGDGLAEMIAYNETQGLWQIFNPREPSSLREFEWRHTYGTIVLRDFDGSGIVDLGLWTNDGRLYVIDSLAGRPVAIGRQFGDEYAFPVHASYEGEDRVNLSYYAIGRGVWHVRLHDGRAVSPTHPQEYPESDLQSEAVNRGE